MRQALSPKKVRRINERTGRSYVSAWNRGGSGAWWMCRLAAGPENTLNAD